MAKSFLTDINLNNNVLLNAKVQAWGSTPTGTTNPSGSGTAVAGQISSYNGALYIFNGTAWVAVGSSGTVTSVTGTSPVVSSGGTTPAISLASGYGDTQNPYASKTANYVLAAPNGSNGAPTFRAIVAADIPTLNQNTTGSAGSTTGTLTFGTGLTAGGASFNGSTNITITPVSATTSVAGIVQLSDSTSTTGSTKAATETAVKAAYDRGSTGVTNAATAQSTADAALPKAGGTMSGAIAMGGSKITGLGTPTADGDAATKAYVDGLSNGVDWKASVHAATTANGTLATAYANGSVIDGVTLATGDRILIKDQTTGTENGIYTVNASGAPTRATDADANAEVTANFAVFVEEGTANADSGWVLTTNAPITVGTTALVFTQFTGLGQITAGNGLTKTGNTLNVVGTTDRITAGGDSIDIASTYVGQTSITTLGTVGTGTWNATAIADGKIASALTGKTYNGLNVTTTTGTLTVTNAKTLSVSNTLTLAGTDSTTMTFPGTSATIARTDAAQTFTGIQTFTTIQGSTALTIQTGASTAGQRNINITGGNNSQTGGSTSGSNVVLTGGNLTGASTAGSIAGAIYAIGGNATNGYGGGLWVLTGTGSNGQGNVNINASGGTITEAAAGGVSILATTTAIEGTVKLPSVANSAAGFVKTASDGTLSRAASVAYSELPTDVGVVARKRTLVGTGSGTTIALTHGLGTNLVTAQVYDTSTSTATLVETDITVTSTVATATFAATTTLSNYTLVVVG